MQLLGRIAIILAAALLVVGIAIGLSHTSYLQNMTPTRGEFAPQSMTGGTAGNTVARTRSQDSGDSGGRNREFGREGHNAASLFGIVQVIQNLLIIGLIVLPFALAPRFMPGRKSGGSGGQPPA
ncbi:MAG: hypothetical protein NT075_16620 [Chloroflexi bacterium]|nr:hypothetical protein [Chloroflexota bacterium]